MPEIWFPNLNIKIDKLSRVAFSPFGFEIYWYSIIIMLGVASGLLLAIHEAKRTGQDPDTYYDFFYCTIFIAFIGARLYYVIFSWEDYKDNLIKIFAFREGGLAIYGGIIASIICAIVYAKVKKIEFPLLVDTTIPSLILGQAIGRWGNLFNREAFGGYTDSLFAVRYLKDQAGYIPQAIAEKIVVVNGFEYIQVQPAFLYESMWNFSVFAFLTYYKRRKKFDGELFLLYLLGYGMGRFWIEGLRTDQLILFGTGLAVSQVLSVILVAIAAVLIIYYRRKTI